MKIVIALLACLFVYVVSESCISSADTCKSTMCRNSTVHCIDNVCTCTIMHSHQPCGDKADCSPKADGSRHCRLDASGQPVFHCIDGECHCEHGFHGGP